MALLIFYLVYPLGFIAAILAVPIFYAKIGIPLIESLNFPADISSGATDWAYHGLSLLFFREPPYPEFVPERIRELGYFPFIDQLTSYLYMALIGMFAVTIASDHAYGLKETIKNLSQCRLKLAKYKTRPNVAALFQTLERSVMRYTFFVLAIAILWPLLGSWFFFSFSSLLRGEWSAFFWCGVVFAVFSAALRITVPVLLVPGELVATAKENAEELRRVLQEYVVVEHSIEVRKARKANK